MYIVTLPQISFNNIDYSDTKHTLKRQHKMDVQTHLRYFTILNHRPAIRAASVSATAGRMSVDVVAPDDAVSPLHVASPAQTRDM